MRIKEAYLELQHAIQALYEKREAANIAELVLEKITGLSRSQRLIQHDQLLEQQQLEEFETCKEALQSGRPVQYVIGSSWFQDMLFKVDERVLIPRPETEELVELIKEHYAQKSQEQKNNFRIIDIGTGSGCIAISLKKRFPSWEVWALDKSKKAIALASENGKLLDADISFVELDILSEAKNDSLPAYNAIVSNPPYIPKNEERELHKHVREHEPHEALFVTNQDPLQFYKAIIDFSSHHLLRGGMIFFETHESYAASVKQLMEEHDFEEVQVKKDMQGKDRIVWGKRTGASL